MASFHAEQKPDGDAGSSADSFQHRAPAISPPKGGGAIRGMGEKFAANPVTGTGSMTVPIATSPGRSGFGPQLSLATTPGPAMGPSGSAGACRCRRSRARPTRGCRSISTQPIPTSSSFPAPKTWFRVLAGRRHALHVTTRTAVHEVRSTATASRYRPRIEGLFARIERWSKIGSPGDVHWRSISKDNILTLYGDDANSRIADPLDASRIFSWLICESRDDKGNGIRYLYKKEDGAYQPRPVKPIRSTRSTSATGALPPIRAAPRNVTCSGCCTATSSPCWMPRAGVPGT